MSSRRGARRAIVLVMAAVLLLPACGDDATYVPAGIVRTPLPDVSDVVLPDVAHDEDLRMVADEEGLLIVYFGYTACPDVCPTTMADLRGALRDLGDLADSIDVAMITVDPDRDTPEVLTAYVQTFVPDGSAVRTTDDELLAEAAQPFGAQYSVTEQEDGWIDVIHSAFLYAIDDTGSIRLTWPFGTESQMIEADIRALFEGKLDDVEA